MSSFKKLNMGAAQGVVALSGFIKFIKKERRERPMREKAKKVTTARKADLKKTVKKVVKKVK